MDLILAVNQNTSVRRTLLKQREMDGEFSKRMNVTKFPNGTMVIANTSRVLNGTDMMLEINLGETYRLKLVLQFRRLLDQFVKKVLGLHTIGRASF